MLKRIFSLTVVLILAMSLTALAVHAEETEPTEAFVEEVTEAPTDDVAEVAPIEPVAGANSIFFDPAGSGWEGYDVIGFHIWEIDDDTFVGYNWGDKEQQGTLDLDGKWFYDLDAANLKVRKGKQYGVIFYAKKADEVTDQTYNLIFGTPCIGHTAACEGTIYENPENSQKTTQAAFWDNEIDPAVYGPELQISSIGTVVGTCCPAGMTPYELFENFLHNTLQNARIYAGKDDQQLLDDTAAGLGLSRSEVEKAIIENGLAIEWVKEKSTLPDDSVDVALTATESADNEPTEKSPKTGNSSVVLLISCMMIAAAAGIILARKQLHIK